MRRPIVLFSTTRMYNPGDDFVLFGIRRLLEEALGPFVPVVHNRNPALHALRGLAEASAGRPDSASAGMAELHRTIAATVPDYDNSWHPGFDMGAVDLAVFRRDAGAGGNGDRTAGGRIAGGGNADALPRPRRLRGDRGRWTMPSFPCAIGGCWSGRGW